MYKQFFSLNLYSEYTLFDIVTLNTQIFTNICPSANKLLGYTPLPERVPDLRAKPKGTILEKSQLITRPNVLQTLVLLIKLVILLFKIFKTLSISNCQSWGVEILKEISYGHMV